MKCPACLKGDLFITKNPYKLNDLFKMPENCTCCGEKFTPEPGFYFGAMYISYGLTVAMAVTIMVSTSVFDLDLSIWEQIGMIAFSIFATIPLLFRVSRAIWINIFVKYRGGECKATDKKV